MIAKVKAFFTEVKTEMSKVTWSSRQELMNSTVIVLVTMSFLALFIGAADFVFSQLLKLILR